MQIRCWAARAGGRFWLEVALPGQGVKGFVLLGNGIFDLFAEQLDKVVVPFFWLSCLNRCPVKRAETHKIDVSAARNRANTRRVLADLRGISIYFTASNTLFNMAFTRGSAYGSSALTPATLDLKAWISGCASMVMPWFLR